METIIYIAKSAGVLTLFYLVYYFILRRDTFFTANRHFLIGGIVAAALLPLVEFTSIVYSEAPNMAAVGFSPMLEITETTAPLQRASFDWWQILLLVYLAGVIVMFVRLAFQLLSLLKLIGQYPVEKKGKFLFVEVTDAISPFSFFNYIVYNPKSHSEEELQMILKHEKVHVSQWHSMDIILANLARILQWVNPFSWLYKKSLEQNLEYIADSKTAQQVPSKTQYQLTLVKASSPLIVPALTNNFYQSFIKKRIIMLNKSTSKRHNIWKVSIILPALAVFLWSFNVTEIVEYTESEIPSEESIIMENSPDNATEPSLIDEAPTKESAKTNSALKKEELERGNNYSLKAVSKEAVWPNTSAAPIETVEKPTGTAKEFRFLITKNTTDAELEKIKAELKKEHDVSFTYSASRNSKGEITSLNISYSSSGNNGSYNVSEDGKAIEDFYFYMDDNGHSGFWSEAHEERMHERKERLEERMIEREERMMERKEEMEERRTEMKVRANEMHERREKMHKRQEEMHERQEEMHRRSEEQLVRAKEIRERIHRGGNGRNVVVRSSSSRGEGDTYVHLNTSDGAEHSIIIDKDTTDETLKTMKKNLAAKGITFNFSKVKRNSQGEITRIKIQMNNGKGSKSTITAHEDDGTAIEPLLIEI